MTRTQVLSAVIFGVTTSRGTRQAVSAHLQRVELQIGLTEVVRQLMFLRDGSVQHDIPFGIVWGVVVTRLENVAWHPSFPQYIGNQIQDGKRVLPDRATATVVPWEILR